MPRDFPRIFQTLFARRHERPVAVSDTIPKTVGFARRSSEKSLAFIREKAFGLRRTAPRFRPQLTQFWSRCRSS